MMGFKQEAVDGNTKGIEFLFKKNKITAFRGIGRILGQGKVEVRPESGKPEVIETKHIVIATGSDPAQLKGVDIDEKIVVTSTGALELEKVPGNLVVIGAGVIGLELGSVWQRLGSNVTVIEYLDRILPGIDGEMAKQFQRLITRQGVTIKLSSKVTSVKASGKGATVAFEPVKGGKAETLKADVVLVATGRAPYTRDLGLEDAGVKLDVKGRIAVGDRFETSVAGIYAVGDVIRGPMLAHKAQEEGLALAETLAGQSGHVNYGVIASVVYTFPEIAALGMTEEDVKAAGIEYRVGKFPFLANGRAKSNQTTDGFVKVLADAATDRVLGVHVMGPQAGELIHEAAVLMEFGGSAEDLARTCHAHPTFSEAVKEAALAVANRAIHA
jgi:dihydrolipoamide dehydrogenase